VLGGDGPSRSGSVEEFRASWRERQEAKYNHWTSGPVRNQVQLAFRCHWEVFRDIIGQRQPGHVLEVGCGRGSLSSYFVANGWQATLLDSSPEVIEIAREIFMTNGHRSEFVVGDALDLPFADGNFDVVASIGLLEHFEKPGRALAEQWRMLKPGGWLLCYIVPERPDNIQRYFNWINWILAATIGKWVGRASPRGKPELYRSDAGSEAYMPYVECQRPAQLIVTGMYSMPMISHSPAFPFSLLPDPMERALVAIFQAALSLRRFFTGRHGWLCEERNGQAFLVAAQRA
jgi:2-polyprenyl-3-methyl-5-hydroxy-6-metoxy-1,4-benzoquinol methylase